MSSNSFSLREAQTLALKHMLSLNQTASQGQSAWKLLIFDDFTRDIISPLLNIGELREQGITLHMNINSKRLPVPDVPAIYFVLPSQSNVERICEDLKSNLYDQIHINFCGSVARNLLEQLADSALQSESVSQISKIHDQFLGFQSLSPSLFTLAQDNSYVAFNDSKVSDIQAQANIERCVEGLYAVLSTSSVVPIIRCARNGAAEMIARALSARLAENAAARLSSVPGSAATSLSSFRRPLLVLLERNVDLAAMLHHPWSYSALLHDALGLRLNRVKINEGEKEKTFDLDAHDTFWAEQAGATFPQVAMEVKTQLAEYTARIERLDALKGNDDANSTSNNENIAAELGNFVSDIPALQAKQAVIETHTSIATCLLKQIKARELDRFYALEEALLARGTCDRAELRHLLGEGKGTSTDRVRLLLVYYLCAAERAGATSAVKQEFETFEAQLKADGVDLRPLQYVRAARAHLNALSLPTAANTDDDNSNSNTDSNNGANWTALSKGYESLSTFTNLFAEGVDRLKSMLPQEQELPVTRIVRALMEQRAMKGVTEQYLYFDPQIDGGRGGPAPTISNDSTPTPFRQAVVFVVGGGNYTEYQNLLDYAVGGGPSSTSSSKRGNAPTKPKTIVYGSTELLNAEQFIQQMNKLS